MAAATIIHGDARHLPLADSTVDAVICDPPYELTSGSGSGSGGFMGKKWDATGVAFDPATWREALRVLKPGGHLLAFGGMRTQHRLICAIEDAGFEIRDAIVWHMSSGFPKSLAVDKAIDRQRNDRPDILRVTTYLADAADEAGVTRAQVDERMGTSDMGGWWLSRLQHRCAVPTWEQWGQLRDLLGFGVEMDAEVWRLNGRKGTPGEAWSQREILERIPDRWAGKGDVLQRATQAPRDEALITAPATDEARRWQGFGTALKPASEIICVARKPLAGKTVAQNVLAYGCGALNIDATRVNPGETVPGGGRSFGACEGVHEGWRRPSHAGYEAKSPHAAGRWPSNVVFSHVALTDVDGQVIGDACDPVCVDGCPVLELDGQSGRSVSPPVGSVARKRAKDDNGWRMNAHTENEQSNGYGDSGGASRYFPTFRYQAKAPSKERPKVDGVAHPCVKPLELLKFLCRLVGGQPGSLVLDPFAGSGSTLEAALLEGFNAVGVEQAAEYLPLIQHRIDRATAQLAAQQPEPETEPTLFDVA